MHSGQRRSTSTSWSPCGSQRSGCKKREPQLGQEDSAMLGESRPMPGRNLALAQPRQRRLPALLRPRAEALLALPDPDRHAHVLVERADDLVRADDRQLAFEAVVRRRGLRVELLHVLGPGLELDVVDVARRLE